MDVKFSKHCLERSTHRSIPIDVVKQAIEKPFMSGQTEAARKWGLINAVIDGTWQFVIVFWEQRERYKLVITTYIPEPQRVRLLGINAVIAVAEDTLGVA